MTVDQAEQALRDALEQQVAAKECLEVARTHSLATGGSPESAAGIVEAEQQLHFADTLVDTRRLVLEQAQAEAAQALREVATAEFHALSSKLEQHRAKSIADLVSRFLDLAEQLSATVHDAFALVEADEQLTEKVNAEAVRAAILDRITPLDDGMVRTMVALELRRWHGRPELAEETTGAFPELRAALSRVGGGRLVDVERRLEVTIEAFAEAAGADVFAWLRPAPDPDVDGASPFALRVPFAQSLLDRYVPEEEEKDDANAAE